MITTGHHLEWLSLAPESLHPPREQIRQAAAWVIQKTLASTEAEILDNYTFYSHVGNALCLWRSTSPSKFWKEWEGTHPFVAMPKAVSEKAETKSEKAETKTDGDAKH